jgi:hypothetical protein
MKIIPGRAELVPVGTKLLGMMAGLLLVPATAHSQSDVVSPETSLLKGTTN